MVPGTGLLAACVPGMFDAWMLMLRDYGTMRLPDILAPAIHYAREGHPLVERANATIATVAELFNRHWPTSAAVYLPGGKVPATGTLFTNATLAETYRACCARPKTPAGIASARSRRRARSGRVDSSPRRSIASAARRRRWT